jgi:hypothetical protein
MSLSTLRTLFDNAAEFEKGLHPYDEDMVIIEFGVPIMFEIGCIKNTAINSDKPTINIFVASRCIESIIAEAELDELSPLRDVFVKPNAIDNCAEYFMKVQKMYNDLLAKIEQSAGTDSDEYTKLVDYYEELECGKRFIYSSFIAGLRGRDRKVEISMGFECLYEAGSSIEKMFMAMA